LDISKFKLEHWLHIGQLADAYGALVISSLDYHKETIARAPSVSFILVDDLCDQVVLKNVIDRDFQETFGVIGNGNLRPWRIVLIRNMAAHWLDLILLSLRIHNSSSSFTEHISENAGALDRD